MKTGIRKYSPEAVLHVFFWGLIFCALVWLTSITHFNTVLNNGKEEFKVYNEYFYPAAAMILLFLTALFYANAMSYLTKIKFNKIYKRVILVAIATSVLYAANYFVVRYSLISIFCNEHEWDHVQRNVVLMFGFVGATSLTYSFAKDGYRNEMLRKNMESLHLSTELNFLKSQINPHFLFNTLNNLFSMAQEKQNNELANGISKLSGMMRYMIYESDAENVTLSGEIDYLKSFIVLNKLRFNDKEVKVNFTYPEKSNEKIAPVLLIPFVENAFKYGLMIKEQSEINIRIDVLDSGILFTCENTDYSFIKKMDDRDKGIGLDNVKRRLELLYPGKHSLEIKNENKKYLVVLKLFKK